MSVEGNGKDSARWECEVPFVKPMRLYRLSFWARRERGSLGGCVIAGLSAERAYEEGVVVSGINRDFVAVGEDWTKCSFIFIAPPSLKKATIYLGQWNVKGKVYFDDVSLVPIEQMGLERGLGPGERILEGIYIFKSHWIGPLSNYSSTLVDFTAGFNTNRWVLGEGKYVVYRHSPGFPQRWAKVKVWIWWYRWGSLAVEASKDGRRWLLAGRVKGEGEHEVSLPKNLFPTKSILVRLRSEGLMQVLGYRYEAKLSGSPPDVEGKALFLEVERPSLPELPIRPILSFGLLREGEGRLEVGFKVKNKGKGGKRLILGVKVAFEGEDFSAEDSILLLEPGKRREIKFSPLRLRSWGEYQVVLFAREHGKGEVYRASTSVYLPPLYATDYGRRLPCEPSVEWLKLWWCGPNRKVSRERMPPSGRAVPISISAGRNEFEPFQLVIRPERTFTLSRVEATPLLGPEGARIGRENVEFLKVEYVKVRRLTDRFGCIGLWPDPLPPIKGPIECPAKVNTPIWVRVYVPKGIPAGNYKGEIVLEIQGGLKVRVPLKLRVYDFTLPDETHTRTAYGVWVNRLFHGIRTDEEEAKVFEFYMRTFAKHRISPYWPVPSLARPRWEIVGPREEIDVGPLKFVCDRLKGNFFALLCGGERVGYIRSTLTQFERKGVGWKGTGFGWPSPNSSRALSSSSKGRRGA